MREISNASRQVTLRWANNWAGNSHLPLRRREQAMLSSGECDHFRSSSLSIPPSSTRSIWSAISTQERISNETEPPPSPSGGNFAPPEKLAVSAEARPVRVSLTTPCALPLNRSCRGILQQGGRLRHQFLCLIQSVHVGTNARNGVVVHMMRN